tara:strand:+ start:164 stop:364 length:201 start_codon:yes stop_codon:yes gene_type:complete
MNKTNLIYAAIIAIIAILIWSLNSKDKVLITDDIQPNDTIPAVVLEELIDSTSKAEIDSVLEKLKE